MAYLAMHETSHLFGAVNLDDDKDKDYLMYKNLDLKERVSFSLDEENRFLILQGLNAYYK